MHLLLLLKPTSLFAPPDPLKFGVGITYPAISNLSAEIKADARLTSNVDFPSGTVIKWSYNSSPQQTYTLSTAAGNLMLSQITGITPVPGLQGHTGTDNWTFEITNAGVPSVHILTIEPVAVLGSKVYPYESGAVTLTVNDLPVPAIEGPSPVCAKSVETYTTEAGMNGYIWNVAGGTGTSTTNSISVTWGTGASGSVSVNYNNPNGCTAASATIKNITINPLPTASVIGDARVCINATPAPVITLTGADGTENYTFTYKINTGGNQTVISSGNSIATLSQATATPGTYVYTLISVMDANGCSQLQGGTATVIVNEPLVAPVAGTGQAICYNSPAAPISVTTPATGGSESFTYKWQSSTDGTNFTDIPGATGTSFDPHSLRRTMYYQVIATDAECGFITSNRVTISVGQPLRQPTIGVDQTICYNTAPDALTITTPATGGTGGFTYDWEKSDNGFDWYYVSSGETFSPGILTETTYYQAIALDMSVPSCGTLFSTNIVEVKVQIPVLPGVIEGTQAICSGAAPTLFTSSTPASGSGDITYQWQQSATEGGSFADIPLATGATYQAGNLIANTWYRRVATSTLDLNSCSAESNVVKVTINELPELTATPTQILCFGGTGSVELNATKGSSPYNFSGSATTNLVAGTYNYTVTDANGCTANASATINAAPSQLVLTATATQISCFGGTGSVALLATGGTVSYTYGGDATTNLVAGTYNYTVTDANGCTANASATINAAPSQLVLTATATQISCFGGTGSVELLATGGTVSYTYGGDATTNLVAGTYNYTVTDANGCTANASATINAAPSQLVLTATATQISCFGGTGSVELLATGGTEAYTYGGDATTNLVAGTYNYTVTDANGCTANASATINAAPSQLVLTATATQISCFGGTGSVELLATGGTAAYTYGGDATTNLVCRNIQLYCNRCKRMYCQRKCNYQCSAVTAGINSNGNTDQLLRRDRQCRIACHRRKLKRTPMEVMLPRNLVAGNIQLYCNRCKRMYCQRKCNYQCSAVTAGINSNGNTDQLLWRDRQCSIACHRRN